MWFDGLAFWRQEGVALVACCLVANIGVLGYASFMVQPLQALVNTVRQGPGFRV